MQCFPFNSYTIACTFTVNLKPTKINPLLSFISVALNHFTYALPSAVINVVCISASASLLVNGTFAMARQ